MSEQTDARRTEPRQDDQALDDQDLDAVNGGILSTGHTTKVSTSGQTDVDDFKREAPRDRDGKIVWTEIDMI